MVSVSVDVDIAKQRPFAMPVTETAGNVPVPRLKERRGETRDTTNIRS